MALATLTTRPPDLRSPRDTLSGKGNPLPVIRGKEIHAFLPRTMPTLDQYRFRTEFEASCSHCFLTFGPQTRADQPACLRKVGCDQSDMRKEELTQRGKPFLRRQTTSGGTGKKTGSKTTCTKEWARRKSRTTSMDWRSGSIPIFTASIPKSPRASNWLCKAPPRARHANDSVGDRSAP